jgi:hypothetical protein
MSEPVAVPLSDLYELDETAWLEQMAVLVTERRFNKIDSKNLSEYLSDMARRDKREVWSRLVTLMKHLLRWQYQPKNARIPGATPSASSGTNSHSTVRAVLCADMRKKC